MAELAKASGTLCTWDAPEAKHVLRVGPASLVARHWKGTRSISALPAPHAASTKPQRGDQLG